MKHEARFGSLRLTPGKVEEQIEITFTEIVKQLDLRWDMHSRVVVRLDVEGREALPYLVLAPGEALRIKAMPPPEQPPARLDVVVQEDDGEP